MVGKRRSWARRPNAPCSATTPTRRGGRREIVPHHEFYDYEGKYLDDSTDLFIPARIPKETSEAIRTAAVRAFAAMGCTGLARVDFFAERDGGIILNEINTLPGFTSISMYPKLFEAAGVPYPELIDRLIRLALEK
ncbi:MAG: hypothetical protein ACLVL7_10675 [Anaerotruncus massiliensis (ex Togo et al. 2019)]